MNTPVALAVTHHDPNDAMLAQAQRVLPLIQALYANISMMVTPTTGQRTITAFRAANIQVQVQADYGRSGIETVGLVRQAVVRAAAEHGTHVHLCDWDRVLHWAESYADELRLIVDAIPRYDLLILGRTPRAFATHPRVQRDTETLINHVFGLAFGQPLDVTAAARGLSQSAIAALQALGDPEATSGQDCAWPLYLARVPDLVVGYAATDGLEWETPDRHAEEIGAAGGLDAWLANFDADPRHWAFRTRLALYEIEAINRWR